MESGILGIDVAPDSSLKPVSVAGERRRAWAQSRDSIGQGSKPEHCGPQGPKQSPSNGDIQRDAEEQGSVPNKISNWLTECRTPLAASLDDQSSSPNRGALRNGCSFEDDLSLGAEANHLQSSKSPSESCFGLAAEQKRNQFKERGRSMNSTGSGKSSTVSSVSELLDLYEEDPEEILLNLGFGQEEPDLSSKIPSRFFNNTSSARGIDIKVYLAAQLQRMELENPNFALTSRFRQIEVLTTVANEFFQLYSQVSGQPVQRISSKDQGNQGVEGGEGSDQAPPLKRTNSALNVAKFLKKTISRHNLLGSSSESPEACPSKLNGSAGVLDHTGTNGHAAEDGSGNYPDHQVEPLGQKHVRRKDNFSLATVTEETSTDGDVDRLMDNSPKHSCSEAQHQPQSADLQPTNPRTGEGGLQVNQEENNFTSTPEKALSSRSPPQLAQLRSENTDSFDMEEIQTNEDEVLRSGPSRTTDLSRTVSQQSDSSGFAEEPSLGSYSHLKVQESYDSCDSETTVTSHPSQDVATPLALDQPAFELPVSREEEPGAAGADGSSKPGPWSRDLHDNGPSGVQQSLLTTEARTEQTRDSAQTPEPEHIQNQSSASEPEPAETLLSSHPPAEGAEDQDQGREPLKKESGSPCPSVPTSPVLRALNRAKQNQSVRLGQPASPQTNNPVLELRQRRRGNVPLQRSSSLPSSLLSPSRVVSSVRIQFGPGQASCTPPQYSYRYTETTEEEEDESCLSTLIINPGSGPVPPAPVPAGPVPTKPVHATPVPRYLLQPSYSLQSCSPPPDHCPAWSTQSVPDLSSSQALLGPVQQNYHNQQIWNSPAMCSDPSPPTSSPFPLPQNPQSPALTPFSSLTSLHQPPPPPPSTSFTNLQHQPPSFSHPGTPTIHHLGYNFPHSHQSPYPAASPSPQLLPPYHSYHGYSTNPYITSPPSISQYPLLTSEHNVHAVLTPPSGVLPSPGPGPGHYPAPGPGYYPSSTEMQLRRVLHEIRGTVQSLNQNRVDTPDGFMDHRGSADCLQSLAEFQQRRRSLNMFRSQMMDLELSIARQHALVYKHLSPADRLEAEQLQSLRSAVREELQELEQQLEDRLLEGTRRHRAHHRRSSIGSLSTSSALKAMEPMSDLLREQFFLQSELAYASQAPSTDPSTRSSSPVREGASGGKQRRGVYRASVNITPAAPPRAHTHPGHLEERGGGLLEERGGGPLEERGGGPLEERGGGPLEERRVGPLEEQTSRHLEERGRRHPEEEPTPGGFRVENFQQLIREIRESVAQEVRREIYSELLAAASPQGSPHPARQPPL